MIWPRENEWDRTIETYALISGIPVALVKAIIAKESSFNPDAYKPEPQINDASMGLMQMLVSTARALGFKDEADQLFDPLTSIKYGAALIAANLKQSKGNVPTAIAAYNAGWSKIRPHDAPRDDKGRFVNQSYVDDVNVYYGYFSGKLTEADVRAYKQGKLLKTAIPFFLSSLGPLSSPAG
jgi:soluble lytic murein transglycosylase-like protein